jgi:hypothetical protein
MDILISAMVLIGEILIAAIALIGGALAAWLAWAALARATVKHEPIEYYLGCAPDQSAPQDQQGRGRRASC